MGARHRSKQLQSPAGAGTKLFPASGVTEPVQYGLGRQEVMGTWQCRNGHPPRVEYPVWHSRPLHIAQPPPRSPTVSVTCRAPGFPLACRPIGPRATRSFVSVGSPLYTTHSDECWSSRRAQAMSRWNAGRPSGWDARRAAGLPRAARLAGDRPNPGCRRQPSLSAPRSHLSRSERRRTEWCCHGSMDGLGYSWREQLYKCYVDRPCPIQSLSARPARQEEAAPPRYLGHQMSRSPRSAARQRPVEDAPETGLLPQRGQTSPGGRRAGSEGARRRH